MNKKHIPSSAITIQTYSQLHDFAARFAEGKYNLLGIVGSAGLSKSQSFKSAMKNVDHCLVKGHTTAFILYKMLFDHKHEPIVIDDADTLYEDKKCQPLLKNLCDTDRQKLLAWQSKSMDDADIPRSFHTTSKVVILCNEWKTVSVNMRAVTDRGIFVNFVPTVREVHRQVEKGGWLQDGEIFKFIEDNLHLITKPSMRYYYHAKQLKDSGMEGWKDLILNMLNPDLDRKAIEVISRLMDEEATEVDRIERFGKLTNMSRATYFRYKKVLADARGS